MNNFATLNFAERQASHNFVMMKRAFAGLLISSLLAAGVGRAADVVALAAQEEMVANYKNLRATVEEIQAAQNSQQKQVSGLHTDLGRLRDDVARNNNSAVLKEQIATLSEQIQRVDKSRIADNQRIQEALERLNRSIQELAKLPPPTKPVVVIEPANNGGPSTKPSGNGGGTRTSPPITNIPDEGYEYVIQRGDALSLIVSRYRAEKIMVTSQLIKDANPGVNWDRLQVGKKIFIPKPK